MTFPLLFLILLLLFGYYLLSFYPRLSIRAGQWMEEEEEEEEEESRVNEENKDEDEIETKNKK